MRRPDPIGYALAKALRRYRRKLKAARGGRTPDRVLIGRVRRG